MKKQVVPNLVVFHGRANTIDWLIRTTFACWAVQLSSLSKGESMLVCLRNVFSILLASVWLIRAVPGVWSSSSSSIYGRGKSIFSFFMAFRGLCYLWTLWGERDNRTFRGRDRDLVRFSLLFSTMFLLWSSILKTFFNYFIGILFIVGVPFCRRVSPFYGLGSFVCCCLYFFHFFLMEVVVPIPK